jgi:hypothetical protein
LLVEHMKRYYLISTFSPVQRHLKFSAVLGTVLPNNPITTRPAFSPPTVTSKKTYMQETDYVMSHDRHRIMRQT